MQILIEKDSATKVPRECTLEQAHTLVAQGFTVHAVGEDGSEQPLPDLPQAETEAQPEQALEAAAQAPAVAVDVPEA